MFLDQLPFWIISEDKTIIHDSPLTEEGVDAPGPDGQPIKFYKSFNDKQLVTYMMSLPDALRLERVSMDLDKFVHVKGSRPS